MKRIHKNYLTLVLGAAATWIISQKTFAATATWKSDAAGNWSAAGSWDTGVVPANAGDTANLTFNITAARVVTLDASETIGILNIGDPTSSYFAYTLSPAASQTLTFNNNGSSAQLNQTTSGGASDTISTAITLSDNLAINNVNGLTLSGIIGGASKGITKTGAGTLTVSGADTFTGATVVNAGTLTLSGSISSSSALTLGGGTLSYTKASGSQTFNGTTFNTGYSTVANATSGQTVALGALTRNSGGILNVSSLTGTTTTSTANDGTGILGTWATEGTGTSLQYATGGGTIAAYGGATAATAGTLANVTSSSGNYSFAAGATNTAAITANTLRYIGAGASWSNAGFGITLNGLMNAGTGPLTNIGTGTITIGANKELVIVGNTQGTLIGSVIANNGGGASSLTYGGPSAGALTLSGANTYSGGTTLSAGTLLLQGNSTPSAAGSTVTSGPLGAGTLTLSGGTYSFAAGANYTIANNVSVGAATSIAVSSAGNTEVLNGNWSGSGNLTLVANGSTGQWQFGGDNSGYTGILTQNSGNTSLAFNAASAGSAGAAWVFNNNTAQRTRLNFGAGTINFGSISGNGSIANIAGSGLATMSIGALNTSTTYSGVIGDGSGQAVNIGLVKVGTGSLALSGAGRFTNTTTVVNGSLIAAAAVANNTAGPFGSNTTAIVVGDATTISSATAMNPQLLIGGAFTMARAVTVGANNNALGNASSTFTLGCTNAATSSTFSGLITLNQSLVITQAAGGALTISGGIISGSSGTQTVMVNSAGPVNISTTAIGGGTGTIALTKTGAGTLTNSAANTYTGNTTVNGGTLEVATAGTGIASGSAVTVNSTGTLLVDSVATVASSSVTVSGGTVGGAGTITGNTTINSSGALTPRPTGGSATTTTFGGNLTLSGASANLTLGPTTAGANDNIVYGNGGSGTLTLDNSDTISITCTSLQQGDYTLFSTTGGTLSMSSAPTLTTNGVTVTPAVGSFVITNSGNNVLLHYLQSSTPATVTAQTASPGSIGHHGATLITVSATAASGDSISSVTVGADGLAGAGDPVLLVSDGNGNWTNSFTAAASLALGSYVVSGSVIETSGAIAPWTVTVNVVSTNSTWNGSGADNKWSTANNWDSGLNPGPGDYVFFSGTTQLMNNLNASLSLAALTFNSGTGSFDVTNAASTLTLAGGLTNYSSSTQTLDVPVALSGAQSINAAAGNVNLSRPVSDSGAGLTTLGSGTSVTLSGVNTYTGPTIIGVGNTLTIGGTGQLGGGAYAAAITDNGALGYNSSAAQTFTGAISGTGSVTNGSGTLTLASASSAYSGGTTLNSGALLVQGNSTPTAAGSTVTSGPLGAGTLTLSGGTFGFAGSTTYTIANNVIVGGATSIEVASGQNEVLNGNWSGSGNLTLIANGSVGQWQFGGDNSGYTGIFTENNANNSLAFNSASAGSANAAWVFNNPTAQRTRLNFGAGTINFGSMSGNGSIANVFASGTATMSVGALNTSTTFSGIIGDGTGQAQNISLVKVGTGTLTLSGANNYTGATLINAGTLTLSGSGSIASSPKIILAGGATLDVSGLSSTFALGAGQVLTNISGTGVLAGNLNLGSGSLALNYTNGTPSLNVTNGTLNFNGNAVTVTVSGGALGAGIYKLVATNSGGNISGTLPATVAINGAGATAPVVLQLVNGELYLVVGATTTALVSSATPSGFKDSVTFTASVQTNGVTAGNAAGTVTFYTNNVPVTTNTVTAGSAGFSSSTLPRGTNLVTAIYSGDVNYLASSNSLNQIVTNHPPMAGNATYTRNAGISGLRIVVSDLLTNVTDTDGDSIMLVSVGNSTNGIIPGIMDGSLIGYYNTNNVDDQFTYTVTDGFGGTNSGTISITLNNVITGQMTGSFMSFTNGAANLTFHGIPNYSYITERSTNLTDWVDVQTNNAGTNGVMNVTDQFNDFGGVPPNSAYYRLKWQP